jgi:hypothetical protein
VFRVGRRDEVLPDDRAMAALAVQESAAPGVLVPDAPGISRAGRRASHWPMAAAQQADLRARREATDSNSVSGAQALLPADAERLRASACLERKKWRASAGQAREPQASQLPAWMPPQTAAAGVAAQPADAPEALLSPELAQE